MSRPAYRAGLFYPGDPAGCRAQLQDCLQHARRDAEPPTDPVAVIVPHAGWRFSGRVAAGALRALATRSVSPEVVVLFGAVHVPGVEEATVTAAEAWQTPLGDAPVDGPSVERLRECLAVGDRAHQEEHSLEVQVPFLQELFPDARIVPIAVPPDGRAVAVGEAVARALEPLGDGVVYLGSTDLSHYGERFGFFHRGFGAPALEWVRTENDARFLELMREGRAEDAVAEARQHHNACGAGAVAATLAAARARGRTRGTVTGYTTSADVLGEREPRSLVGYGGVVY